MTKRAANINKRSEERLSVELKVDLGYATGLTRDISVSGVFFQINEENAFCKLGNEINLLINLDASIGKLAMKCSGKIIRIEPQGELIGVATKITASKLELVN